MRAYRKPLLAILLLVVSPMVLALVAGAIFLAIQLASGVVWSQSIENLAAVVGWLMPYLPYITGVPALLFLFFLLARKRKPPA